MSEPPRKSHKIAAVGRKIHVREAMKSDNFKFPFDFAEDDPMKGQ